MERIIKGINRLFHGNKRQMLTAIALLLIVYVLLLAGIFSYFHSEDTVTNRLAAKNGSVAIQEPNWDNTGKFDAKSSEPGMKISKNPMGYNDGQIYLYIRLKMTIELDSLTQAEKDLKTKEYKDNYLTADNDIRRLKTIAENIKYVSADNAEPFIELDTTDADVRNWSITDCSNSYFVFDAANQSVDNDKLVFYFYYSNGQKDSEGHDLMCRVAPNELTKELFHRVDIPEYKKDYLGVFDLPYKIIVQAEGIPVESAASMLVDNAKAEFEYYER
ncbi:hypothetical protein [Ruminococcus sp.]|uniref:hypothetical protein n=1 Tax=Ruminococcus sp. TaxID=41978 RepID=UPI0025D26512|nr:hypothetical protein [Ruminococcus sp.]